MKFQNNFIKIAHTKSIIKIGRYLNGSKSKN